MDVTQQVKMYDTARLAVASTSGSRSAASGKVSLELSLLALCMHGGVGIFFAHDEGNGADRSILLLCVRAQLGVGARQGVVLLRARLGVGAGLGVALLRARLGVGAGLGGLRVIHMHVLIATSSSAFLVDDVKHLPVHVAVRRLSRFSHTSE